MTRTALVAVILAACGKDGEDPIEPTGPDAAPEVYTSFHSLVTGADFSCYVHSVQVGDQETDDVECWGSNASGVLGEGDADRVVPESTGRQALILAAGRAHLCGADGLGSVICWGELPIDDDDTDNLELGVLAAGDDHTCALTPYLKAYCWGSNEFGQLGHDSSSTSEARPVQVAGDLLFSTIRAGRHVTCGIEHGTRLGYCWGRDDHGQLGDGGAIDEAGIARAPVAVMGGRRLKDIGVGDGFVCAAGEAEEIYCWGRNDRGQLGSGTEDSASPSLVSLPTRPQGVAVGGAHACSVYEASYCWGANDSGQLGVAEPVDFSREPVEVQRGIHFEHIAASPAEGGHTCGIEPGSGYDNVYCWGRNDHGQLGNGTSGEPDPRPAQVMRSP